MKLHFPLLSLSLFFAACDGGKATVQLFDVGSEENLSGLTVTSNGDSDTTNSLGKGKVKVPDAGG